MIVEMSSEKVEELQSFLPLNVTFKDLEIQIKSIELDASDDITLEFIYPKDRTDESFQHLNEFLLIFNYKKVES